MDEIEMRRILICRGEKPIIMVEIEKGFKIEILDPYGRIFLNEKSTFKDIETFLEKRVFPNRKDESTRDALKNLGIEKYDVIEIIKRTNGRMVHDSISVTIE